MEPEFASVTALTEIFALMDRRKALRAELRASDKTLRLLIEKFEAGDDEPAVEPQPLVSHSKQLNWQRRKRWTPEVPVVALPAPLPEVAPPDAKPVSIAEALEESPLEREVEKFKQTLNHQGGCGHDVSVLRKRFLDYLISHGSSGQWLSRSDMCHATHAWLQFGKRVVDPLLESMVAEGVLQMRSTPNGREVRLTAA